MYPFTDKNANWFKILDKQYEHLNSDYRKLEKKRIEISKGEYVYSLIQHYHDKKKVNSIKSEMELPSEKKSKKVNKNGFYRPNLNIFNYKAWISAQDGHVWSSENEILDGVCEKFEGMHNRRMIPRKKRNVTKVKPFNFENGNRRVMTESTGYNKTFITNECNTNWKHNNYFIHSLNDTLYNIICNAQNTQDTFLTKSTEIVKQLKKKLGEYSIKTQKHSRTRNTGNDTKFSTFTTTKNKTPGLFTYQEINNTLKVNDYWKDSKYRWYEKYMTIEREKTKNKLVKGNKNMKKQFE